MKEVFNIFDLFLSCDMVANNNVPWTREIDPLTDDALRSVWLYTTPLGEADTGLVYAVSYRINPAYFTNPEHIVFFE
jgi:hypothetical protein